MSTIFHLTLNHTEAKATSPKAFQRPFGRFCFERRVMEEQTRVAIIAMIIDNDECIAQVNGLLHQYNKYIIGRMGIPYRERGLNIINIVIDAPNDAISTLSGKLGRLKGVTSKAVYSKVTAGSE